MTADALVAAIRADPGADLPRLTFADWRDDRGDPDRAEFVRVQCELAKIDEWDARRPALEDREHELLDAYEAAWLGDPGGLDEWEWRRGFVDEVSGHFLSIRQAAEAGFAGHPVRAANVTSWRTGPNWPDGMPPGPWLAPLRRLSVAGTEARPPQLAQLLRSPHLADLTALDISQNPGGRGLADAVAGASCRGGLRELSAGGGPDGPHDFRRWGEVLAGCPLERLDTPGSGMTTPGLQALLDALAWCPLVTLDVSDNPLDGPAAGMLLRVAPPTVRRLDVSGTGLGNLALHLLLTLPNLAGLTDLSVNRCRGREAAEALAASPFWANAESLRWHSAEVTDYQLAPLAAGGSAKLRLLDLGDNAVRLAGVRHLASARWAGSLTWLGLSNNDLADAACPLLASGAFGNLRTLHLAFNGRNSPSPPAGITDLGAATLAASPGLARLRLLTLSHTQITDRAVPTLLDAPHWRLSGLGLAGCDLGPWAVHALAASDRLRRLQWLDLSSNPRLGGDALVPLAESPHLSRLCELDIGGIAASDRVRAALRDRLGRRLSD
jgi:uncharacterized protein (TIGR02996 family)